MVKKKVSHHTKIFLAIIIGFAVISFWRGTWQLLDLYLLPNSYELSNWISLLGGLIILIITGYVTKELL